MCNNIFLVSQKHYTGTQKAHCELIHAWPLPGVAQLSELVAEDPARAGIHDFMSTHSDR